MRHHNPFSVSALEPTADDLVRTRATTAGIGRDAVTRGTLAFADSLAGQIAEELEDGEWDEAARLFRALRAALAVALEPAHGQPAETPAEAAISLEHAA